MTDQIDKSYLKIFLYFGLYQSVYINCRDEYVYPKFTRWKNIKSNSVKHKSHFYRKILLDEINNKHRSIKKIRKQYQNAMDDLNANLTYFKQHVLKLPSIELNIKKKTS